MIENQAAELTPEKPEPKIADACSCTTCDSSGCFACRQNKCCSYGQCNFSKQQPKNTTVAKVDSKTSVVYESNKIAPKEIHSNSSDLIASIKKPLSRDCVCGKKNTDKMTIGNKYSDLENRLKDKLERICKANKELCKPAPVDTADQVATVKKSDKGLDSVGTKLSAQIMNLSYKDFKQSLSCNRSDTSSFKVSKLSKYDIFQKIKEVYKACSCKVCECLVTKTTRNDLCKCKPCECSDCLSYIDKLKETESTGASKDCCGCKQYGNTFSGIAKQLNDNKLCSCKPCDCIECAADYFMKACDCDPCQCIECRTMYAHKRTPVIVAPVVDDSQRNLCQCSPCECIECGRSYGLPSNLVHEMATGTNRSRHAQCRCELCQNEACEPDGVGSCKCDRRNRVMSKPVERDSHEYDIRTVLINNPTVPKHNRHDAITMFAALSNICPNFTQNKTNQYGCNKYDCLVCSEKEDAINAIKSSRLFTPAKLSTDRSNLCTDACKCQTCECEICDKYNESLLDRQNKCLCDICDCVKCRRRKVASTTKQINNTECICRYCARQRLYGTCVICKKCLRAEKLCGKLDFTANTVSTSQDTSLTYRDTKRKMKSQQESLSVYETLPTIDFPQQSTTPNSKTPSFGTIGQVSMPDFTTKRNSKQKSCNIIKCSAYTQYKERNKGLYKSNSMVYKASGSYYSDSSSIKTNSKSSSYYKDNGSITHVSRLKDKSFESSCNSSGYDYSDYLVQFPKTTVETCLKDVLKLNLDTNIKIDKLNIAPKSPNRKRNVTSTSYENSTGKQGLSQGYDENRKHKQYYKDIRLKRKTYKNKDTYTLERSSSKKIAAYKNRQHCYFPDTRENISLYKSKNKCTQIGDQQSKSIRIGGYETERSNRIKLQTDNNHIDGEHQISRNLYDYRDINHEVPNRIQNDQFLWKCSHTSPLTYFSNNIAFFKIDEDYKRIQKTLQEAKVFSSDLMKILEKYEKDNREFVSVSEKLKHKQMSILNRSNIKNKEIYDERPPFGDILYRNPYLNETEHELRQIHLENPSTEEHIPSLVFPKRILNERSQESPIIQQTGDVINFNNTNTSVNTRSITIFVPKENAKVHKEENETSNQEVIEAAQDLNNHKSCKGKSYKRVHRYYSKLMKRKLTVSKKTSVKNTTKKFSTPPVISATSGTYNTITLQTEVKDNVPSESVNKSAVGHCIKINETANVKNIELNRVVGKLDAVLGNTTDMSVCTSFDKMDQTRENTSVLVGSTAMQTQDIEGRTPWPILKKNFSLAPKPSTKSKGVYIFPSLQLDVKEAVESISLLTRNKEWPRKHVIGSQSQHMDSHLTNKTVELSKMLDISTQQEPAKDENDVRRDTANIRRKSKLELELKDPPKAISMQTSHQKVGNKDKEITCEHLIYSTTDDIERQIKDLLNLSLLQPIMKKLLNSDSLMRVNESESRLPRIESSKSSCEALKASFLAVRRVSDHTVLVKWNLPREVTDVQGYELLVDGRAVQKIFSPSKCMAVITCLPHADKILLTIRTITAMVARTGHYPAASIIYRPRIK